jgi:hypothetical protein
MKVRIKMNPSRLRELIVQNWGTSSIGVFSILVGLLGNLTADDLQSFIDWFNTVVSQENRLMRVGLILAGVAGLLSRDPNTPSGPPPANSSDPTPATSARTSEASEVSATTSSPVNV